MGRSAVAALLLLVAGLPLIAEAQLFRWTNEKGEVHFSEGVESVPQRFRANSVILGHPQQRPAPAPAAATRGAAEPGASDAKVLSRIPFVPGVPIVVSARVNQGRSVQLLLDTGADRTMISPQALSALGVNMRPQRRALIQGVTGNVEADTIMLESIEVGEAKAASIEVIAHNPNLTRGEGLLGRDFLDRFVVNIDTRARVVLVTRR
ncbi:MAG TPA: retroviral-like aspartic protease family protein [Candidatus Limnocylindrales bacterium]|nr:retroviral-like aspartic protease family protein [Candidatus Limnocylindrales bacterium]